MAFSEYLNFNRAVGRFANIEGGGRSCNRIFFNTTGFAIISATSSSDGSGKQHKKFANVDTCRFFCTFWLLILFEPIMGPHFIRHL